MAVVFTAWGKELLRWLKLSYVDSLDGRGQDAIRHEEEGVSSVVWHGARQLVG